MRSTGAGRETTIRGRSTPTSGSRTCRRRRSSGSCREYALVGAPPRPVGVRGHRHALRPGGRWRSWPSRSGGEPARCTASASGAIMGIEGDDVEAIFKLLQLDPGFAQHYMDVRYEVVDEKHGFFELAVVRRAHGRRAVGRAGGHRHVPHHRGRHVRRHRPVREPEGAHPPRPPAAPAARRPRAACAAGSW